MSGNPFEIGGGNGTSQEQQAQESTDESPTGSTGGGSSQSLSQIVRDSGQSTQPSTDSRESQQETTRQQGSLGPAPTQSSQQPAQMGDPQQDATARQPQTQPTQTEPTAGPAPGQSQRQIGQIDRTGQPQPAQAQQQQPDFRTGENLASPDTEPLGMTSREFDAVARVANQNPDISAQDLTIRDGQVAFTGRARRERAAEQFEQQLGPREGFNPRAGVGGGSSRARATTGQPQTAGFDVDFGAGDVQFQDRVIDADTDATPTPTEVAELSDRQRLGEGAFAAEVTTLSPSGRRELGQAAQERFGDLREAPIFQPDPRQTDPRQTDLTPSETARQDRQAAIEQNAMRGGIGSLTPAEVARQERGEFTELIGAAGGTPDVSPNVRARTDRQTAIRERALRAEAADVYSERLGFDVPARAVDIEKTTRGGQTLLVPELDTSAAKEAGRSQTDIFSGLVESYEQAAGLIGAGRQQASLEPADVPGQGSIENVRSVEEFAGEEPVSGALEDTDILGFDFDEVQQGLQTQSQQYQENVVEPAGDAIGTWLQYGNPVGLALTGSEAVVDTVTGNESSATERYAEGIGSGIAGTTDVFGLASTGLTVADVGATGVQRISQGEGAGYASALGAAGVSVAASGTESLAKNPAQVSGSIVGGVAADYGVGALAGPRLPLRYQSARFSDDVTAGEGGATYRGIVTQNPLADTPTPRVGLTGARPTLGTPEIDFEGPSMAPNTEGYAPTTPLSTSIVDANLRRQLEGADLQYYESARTLQRTLGQRSRTQAISDRLSAGQGAPVREAIQESQKIPDPAVDDVTEYIRETDTFFGGSGNQLAQIGEARTPDDIDIYTKNTNQASQELAEILREYSDREIRVRGGVEVKTDQGWDHMVDVNEYTRGMQGRKDWAGRLYSPTRDPEGIPIQSIESQVSSKVEGGLRLFDGDTVGPKTYRLKDTFDLETLGRQLGERKQQSLNPFERRRGRQATQAAEQLEEAAQDLDVPGESFEDLGDEFTTTTLLPDEPVGTGLFGTAGAADADTDIRIGMGNRGQADLTGPTLFGTADRDVSPTVRDPEMSDRADVERRAETAEGTETRQYYGTTADETTPYAMIGTGTSGGGGQYSRPVRTDQSTQYGYAGGATTGGGLFGFGGTAGEGQTWSNRLFSPADATSMDGLVLSGQDEQRQTGAVVGEDASNNQAYTPTTVGEYGYSATPADGYNSGPYGGTDAISDYPFYGGGPSYGGPTGDVPTYGGDVYETPNYDIPTYDIPTYDIPPYPPTTETTRQTIFPTPGPDPYDDPRYRPNTDEDEQDEPSELWPDPVPEGVRYKNPVASGSQFLFGSALGDSVGGPSEAENILPGGQGTPTDFILNPQTDTKDPFGFMD